MSEPESLLLFLGRDGEAARWSLIRGGAIAARGEGVESIPGLADDRTREPLRVAAVAPADAVSLHWLEIPAGLAPAQAAAAARLIAAEVSAQALGEMHIAVGPESGDATRPVAIVPALAMAGWLSSLQAHGLDPDVVIPEPLLLPRPAEGFLFHELDGVPLYRGRDDAFSVEPELAALVTGGAGVETLDGETFDAALAAAVAAPAVNLRQGAFAKRRRWKIEWPLLRRLATLGLAILLVTLLIQIAAIMRYTFAADALEQELELVAGRALPNVGPVSNAPVQLEQRLSQLRGSGAGYSTVASALFSAVRATPNAELTSVLFEPGGTLRATVQADSPATIAALGQRIEASGFAAETGSMRSGGGRPTAEVTVRMR